MVLIVCGSIRVINNKGIIYVSILEKIKEITDASGITDKSKIYTPFTAFCFFFAIYYNLDGLVQLFSGTSLKEKLGGVKLLTEHKGVEWLAYLSAVIGSALGMTAVYAFGQVASAGLWSLGNWANAEISYLANKPKYVLVNEHSKLNKLYGQVVIKANGLQTDLNNRIDNFQVRENKLKDKNTKLSETLFESKEEINNLNTLQRNSINKLNFTHAYISTLAAVKDFTKPECDNFITQNSLVDLAMNFLGKFNDTTGNVIELTDSDYSQELGKLLALYSGWYKGELNAYKSIDLSDEFDTGKDSYSFDFANLDPIILHNELQSSLYPSKLGTAQSA